MQKRILSKRLEKREVPMIRNHRNLPSVFFFRIDKIAAFENSLPRYAIK